jgi:hypothetical protein
MDLTKAINILNNSRAGVGVDPDAILDLIEKRIIELDSRDESGIEAKNTNSRSECLAIRRMVVWCGVFINRQSVWEISINMLGTMVRVQRTS